MHITMHVLWFGRTISITSDGDSFLVRIQPSVPLYQLDTDWPTYAAARKVASVLSASEGWPILDYVQGTATVASPADFEDGGAK